MIDLRRPTRPQIVTASAIAGSLLLLSCGSCLVGIVISPRRTAPSHAVSFLEGAASRQVYLQEEFTRTFSGMHMDEVRKVLGEPDDIGPSPLRHNGYNGTWEYKNRTRVSAASPPQWTALAIEGNRVAWIYFNHR